MRKDIEKISNNPNSMAGDRTRRIVQLCSSVIGLRRQILNLHRATTERAMDLVNLKSGHRGYYQSHGTLISDEHAR